MNSTKWEVWGDDCIFTQTDSDEGGDLIAFFFDTENGPLIAAAPELLEALEYARRFMNPEDFDLEYVDSVINKAKGAE